MRRRTFLHRSAALAALPALRPFAAGAAYLGAHAVLRVDGARLNGWLAAFDKIGRTPTGINRVAYSPADLAGREFTLGLFREARLTPRLDTAGNIFGRVEGTDRSLPPILIGSHVDSVTDGGNYDGPVGSFGAIEVARSLRDQGVKLRHPVDVVVWTNEEGGTVGSKCAIGHITPADLDKVARSGKTIREGIGLVGGNVEKLAEAVKKKGDIACYMELHIEQGGLLEKANLQIGVVQGIVGLQVVGGDDHRLLEPRRHHADGSAPGRHARRGEVHRRGERGGARASRAARWRRWDGSTSRLTRRT